MRCCFCVTSNKCAHTLDQCTRQGSRDSASGPEMDLQLLEAQQACFLARHAEQAVNPGDCAPTKGLAWPAQLA